MQQPFPLWGASATPAGFQVSQHVIQTWCFISETHSFHHAHQNCVIVLREDMRQLPDWIICPIIVCQQHFDRCSSCAIFYSAQLEHGRHDLSQEFTCSLSPLPLLILDGLAINNFYKAQTAPRRLCKRGFGTKDWINWVSKAGLAAERTKRYDSGWCADWEVPYWRRSLHDCHCAQKASVSSLFVFASVGKMCCHAIVPPWSKRRN